MIQTEYKYANAAIGNEEKVLKDIHLKSKNITIYQRSLEALNKELKQIADQEVEFRASGTVEEILSKIKEYFDNNLPECPALFKDISGLFKLFESITESSSFRFLLATISTNMCRKFHTDVNDIRLLCTYIGPGTLWVPDEVLNIKALRSRKTNEGIIPNIKAVQQVNTGDVVLLKGALYPEANPILHRSPPIEAKGEKRLLLRIDTNEFLDFLT